MKILHTSDWHLGQNFMGKSRLLEHQALVAWLLERVAADGIELVIIAGDVFDTGAPPSYARELYNRLVILLRERQCQLLVIAGNHDSVSMLNESKSLLACLDTHVISAANANDLDSHVLEITDNTGTVAVIVCAVPFIRPKDLLTSEAGQDEKTKKQSLLTQIGDFYRALFERAQSLQQKHTHYVPIIGTGHLTSLGASISESVREIYVGTLESVPVELFPAFDYLALGHIHRAQTVAGLDHIRYSGSPIPLSFDELAREKTLVLLDTSVRTEGNKLIPELLSIPRFQRLLSVSGTLPEVLADIAAEVTVADQQAGADSLAPLWLEVRITADDYLSDLHKSLQEAMADKPIELLRVIRQAKTATAIQPPQTQTTLAELTVTEVFERCLDAAVGQEEDMVKQALLVAFNESLVAVQSALQGDETL